MDGRTPLRGRHAQCAVLDELLDAARTGEGRDLGSTATIGRGRAIVSFHGLRYGGVPAFLSWLFLHMAFLTGFRNRFGALIGWS
jgi:NADH:quinone reductase (non-electrogenic)